MSLIKELEEYLVDTVNKSGYEINNIILEPSSKKEFGEFQLNIAMQLAKMYHISPNVVANNIIKNIDKYFTNINVQGVGFINLTLNEKTLIEYMKLCLNDFNSFVDKVEKKKIFIDYGGANVAKSLHVGHMRSANIGESLKRLIKLMGHDVISDAHLGDIGRQSGMVIYEIMERNPELPYFKENYNGEDVELPYTNEELDKMYPIASTKAKSDEKIMEIVRNITSEIDKGHKGYNALWKKIKDASIISIKKIYQQLDCDFDLWEGEMDCYPYIDETLKLLEPYSKISDGAKIVEVSRDDDTKPVPPLILIKQDGATNYATRELATLISRMKRFSPDEILYVVDSRQALHFEQVFRVSRLASLVNDNVKLEHLGFGTMNGKDNKPFKTRDGSVENLTSLINDVEEVTLNKVSESIEDKEKVAKEVAIASLKYSDLLPYRTTDYVFDIDKFNSTEGKTGAYILYTTVRINSLLMKNNKECQINNIPNQEVRDIFIKLIELPKVLKTSYEEKSLSYICEYLYTISNLYNKLYNEHNILNEENDENRSTLLAVSKLIYNVNKRLLDILAIKIPKKM